jgi:probable phosphoglycerate mutase
MKLYFIRHGESEANVLREISNRGLKHGLTAKGRQQASTLAAKLKGSAITKVYASPLLRAQQTAEILSGALGVGYEISDALREYDCGILEGRSDQEAWDMHHAVSTDWFTNKKWDRHVEGGESFLDIKARFVPFVEQLIQQPDLSADIALVGHGGTFISMLPLVLYNIDHSFTLENGMTNTGYVLAEATADGLRCAEWCEKKV